MAGQRILVVNAGSSSLKLSALEEGVQEPVWACAAQTEGLADVLATAPAVDAVGHRIVHGGAQFRDAVLVDQSVRDALQELVALAPLHQPKSLAALDATSAALPDVPAVACFDTAFHATITPAAAEYALPVEWRRRWGLRRYGFHGLSHAYIARRVPELLGREAAELRIVSCHLGAGASLCAIAAGQSVDTTMGFTPMEGLVMATRSGSVDPGLLLWLLERTGLSEPEMADALEHRSGLFGLTGTADMQEVLSRRAAGDAEAAHAVDVYLHRLRAGVGAMAAALDGIDALVFTGGVGEHAPEIRDEAAGGLHFLGPFEVLRVPAREDLEIARQVRAALRRR